VGYKLSSLEKRRLSCGDGIKKLIVGIDPGNVTGIATIDLKGNIIDVVAKKFLRRAHLIEYIMQLGSPLVIASDVNPMPRSVKEIAKSLGCKVYYPEKSLTNVEKIKLLRKYKNNVNVRGHKKDALAAAIKAYRHYHPLLKKIEDELKTDEEKKLFENIATKLITGEVDNIKKAIQRVLNERRIV